MNRWLRVALALGVLCALVVASRAEARRQRELPYGFEQVWNAALRLVRVDLRMPVTDRDQDGGFVLFDYVANGKQHPGSIELVAQARGPRPATLAIVQVQGMPSYVEQMLLDKLEKKLSAEYGVPPPPPKPVPTPTPAPAEDDGGASQAPKAAAR